MMIRTLGAVIASLSLLACGQSSNSDGDIVDDANIAEPVAADLPNALADTPSGNYVLDKTHAYIVFSYSHLGFSNPHVGFQNFDISLKIDADKPANSALSMTIDADSVYSRVQKFDEHLKSDDFFDTANHPTISFQATEIDILGKEFEIVGDLTIKDVSKSITVAGTINKTGPHPFLKKPAVGISGRAKINRSEWGLGYAVPNVGDEVTIYLEAEFAHAE